jgi:phosphoglycolate phosphatase-like HAD superfamily hydrolase
VIILFDIDMTLVHTGGAGSLAIRRVFQRRFGVEDALLNANIRLDGMVDHDIFLQALAGFEDVAGTLYADSKVDYLAELAITIAEREGRVLPGVEALIAALKAENAAIGLATGNYREGARIKLSHYGLWDHFPAGGFGDHHSERADVVRSGGEEVARARGLRFDPAQTFVIGDTPRDIKAARAIGARAVAVATGNYTAAALAEHNPDLLYEDLSDTAMVLAALLGR